ncbi:hypothetical protein GCM10023143_33400 [Compostibacter hankyongensis]|uniref:Uncharacterized protein n=2 Tax=Compostibacter hankyongensis TaxID=1007089 RepID=A0ABP8G948_9BACT
MRKLGGYIDSLRSGRYRDSLLRHLSKEDREQPDTVVSKTVKSEEGFRAHQGKIIRNIYYRQLPVFGPRNINDTSFRSQMKLINFANRLHYNTRLWAIRQSLFFHPGDTVNAYALADNERYLRNQDYISDARLYIINADSTSDSVDVQVITKDEFEYGGDLSSLTTKKIGARVYNTNFLGAAQRLQAGFMWNDRYRPPWNVAAEYTKYNLGGTFTDVSLGYTALTGGGHEPLDTGVYEGTWYINIDRPLYTRYAKFTGGLYLADNRSLNIYGNEDSLFRDYRYRVMDVWSGYNFRNQFGQDGSVGNRPSLALLLRYYDRSFQRKPLQEKYAANPIYNDRHFYLAQFVLFKQDFFKTDHFYGFGRTEDIPNGYTLAATVGSERWSGRKRFYTGISMQRFWLTAHKDVFYTDIGLSSFWRRQASEDAVIHAGLGYYSRLCRLGQGFLRQFFSLDYLNDPNPYLYRPLNINMDNGIWGFRHTLLNGYQRLKLESETVYYSPLKVYGFKFNFFTSLQIAELSDHNRYLFNNPIYAGIGAGCRIRNENLAINTLKLAANYYPVRPDGMRGFYFELTTIANLRFNIFALRKPAFLDFE